MKKIVIIDSGGTNISSIIFALKRLGFEGVLTKDKQEIKNAEKLLLPGVGSAKWTMEYLQKNDLISTIKSLTQPVLGICLGMQILYEFSEEGDVECLGIIDGKIKKIPNGEQNLSVPHMGWNKIIWSDERTRTTKEYAYFIHSYYAAVTSDTVAMTRYSTEITAMVKKDNFWGYQFHPEKSADFGENILKEFLEKI